MLDRTAGGRNKARPHSFLRTKREMCHLSVSCTQLCVGQHLGKPLKTDFCEVRKTLLLSMVSQKVTFAKPGFIQHHMQS